MEREYKNISQCNRDIRQFVAAARVVAELLGTLEEGWGLGCISTGQESLSRRYQYVDERVRIEAARETLAIQIEMREPHSNPVVSIYDGGRVVRTHGEWRMIREHVLGLAGRVLSGGTPAHGGQQGG